MDKKKEIDVYIGSKLKEMREAKNFSLRYVANRIGKSNVTISHYESGRNATDLPTLKKLCNLYDVDMLQFLSDIYDKL
ncbi:MAG: helix-turn-helix transcriptional regulator [Erysipelotrichaceae bacterium]|nr:helix-turn-helix transcriptional regulator [Erysipelotrichaceae bacterium]